MGFYLKRHTVELDPGVTITIDEKAGLRCDYCLEEARHLKDGKCGPCRFNGARRLLGLKKKVQHWAEDYQLVKKPSLAEKP